MLFLVIVANKELHKEAAVFGLFLVWSLIEVVRYELINIIIMYLKIYRWASIKKTNGFSAPIKDTQQPSILKRYGAC